jgi:hypothetical protein
VDTLARQPRHPNPRGLDGVPARTNQDQRDAIAAAMTARQHALALTETIGIPLCLPGRWRPAGPNSLLPMTASSVVHYDSRLCILISLDMINLSGAEALLPALNADSALQDWPCAYIARGAHISHSGAQLTHHAAKGVMADEKLLARQSRGFYIRPLLLFLPHSY